MNTGEYIWATFNIDITEGIGEPYEQDQEIAKRNSEIMSQRFHDRINEVTRANLLEGITFEVREDIYCLRITSGPQEKIDALDAFLREKNYGTAENDDHIPLRAGLTE